MSKKKACIVADLRTGKHLIHIPEVSAILSAAGWKTDVSLKEYGGETLQLAQKAAQDGYNLVIGYGGDGTLNAICNGVMNGGKSLIADIPGGTYDTWAHAIGLPIDPVKAALAIVNSEARWADLGHVEVEGLTYCNLTGGDQQVPDKAASRKKPKRSSKIRQHFLLNIGIGVDAAMISHISKPLKYRVGPLAFDLSLLKELPEQHPFPVEVKSMNDKGDVEIHWQGKVWEIFVSKVPLFGKGALLEPEARADDGLLYVCLITANGPVKTVEQVFSVVAQHKPDEETTQYFKGKHFFIQVPASIGMHVDGSIVKLEEFLHKSEQNTVHQASDLYQVMVNYRFDIEQRAVQLAIPRTYDGSLFTRSVHEEKSQHARQLQTNEQSTDLQFKNALLEKQHQDIQKRPALSSEPIYRVTVIGTPVAVKDTVLIVAGSYKKEDTDETVTVAVRINSHTLVSNSEDGLVASATILELPEGAEIVVAGNKTKRNVIRAHRVKYSY